MGNINIYYNIGYNGFDIVYMWNWREFISILIDNYRFKFKGDCIKNSLLLSNIF